MNTKNLKAEVDRVLTNAEILYSTQEVESALDKMAGEIRTCLEHENPLILCPMIGGIVVTGAIITRLDFPLEIDYIHATRYRGETTGKELQWIRKPRENVAGRTVLILDDILDEGITLEKIILACKVAGAGKVYTGVLIDKKINSSRNLEHADFTGLVVPDRYVFGYGMDYKGYLRNCRGIYAVSEA